ncbi:MAG: hypothetical protein WDO15_04400 [Bacteroidota bacterium]
MVYSAGGGVRIDMAWIFKKVRQKDKYYFDLSATMIQGGRVNYMNEDAPDPYGNHALKYVDSCTGC